MELIKIIAIALLGALLSLTVRRTNGEIALLISIGAVLIIAWLLCDAVKTIYDAIIAFFRQYALPETVLSPLFKCAGISVIAKISAELCRQSGESALALKTEIAGVFASVIVSLPLLQDVFRLIAGLPVICS